MTHGFSGFLNMKQRLNDPSIPPHARSKFLTQAWYINFVQSLETAVGLRRVKKHFLANTPILGLRQTYAQLQQTRTKLLDRLNPPNPTQAQTLWTDHKRTQKQIRVLVAAYKQRRLDRDLERLLSSANGGNDFWKALGRLRGKPVDSGPSTLLDRNGVVKPGCDGFRETLTNYFTNLATLNPTNAACSLSNLERVKDAVTRTAAETHLHYLASLDAPFDDDELANALRRLKRGAPGVDCITNTQLKNCFDTAPARKNLLELMNTVWENRKIIDTWKTVLKKPFLKKKKSDPRDLDNYRGIGLMCTLTKLLERMMTSRLENFVAEHQLLADEQGGFRRGRGCPENLFCLTEALHESDDLGRPISRSLTSARRTTKFGRTASCSSSPGWACAAAFGTSCGSSSTAAMPWWNSAEFSPTPCPRRRASSRAPLSAQSCSTSSSTTW